MCGRFLQLVNSTPVVPYLNAKNTHRIILKPVMGQSECFFSVKKFRFSIGPVKMRFHISE